MRLREFTGKVAVTVNYEKTCFDLLSLRLFRLPQCTSAGILSQARNPKTPTSLLVGERD